MSFLKSFVLTLLTAVTAVSMYAQPAGYANQESNSTGGLCITCAVDNPNNAVDGSLVTFSQLNIPVGVAEGFVEQTLKFPFIGLDGDQVVLVMGVADVLDANALANIRVTTFLGGISNNDELLVDMGSVNALGDGVFVFKFIAQFDFDWVQVLLKAPVAGASDNLKIYAGYDKQVFDAGGVFLGECTSPDNTSSGVQGTCVDLLGMGCKVNNAVAAIDGDENTFSELLIETAAINAGPFQIVNWDAPACGVDSVSVLLSGNDGAGGITDLLDLVINPTAPGEEDGAIQIAAVDINNNVIVGSEQYIETTALSLADANNLRYTFTYVPAANIQEYYGVRIWYHGLSAASGLNWHEACVNRFQPPAPDGSGIVLACYNSIQNLTVVPAPNTVAYWYDVPNPTSLENDHIYVGNSFDPSANNPGFTFTSDVTYYIYGRNVDKDCFSLEYDSVFVDVYPQLPDPLQLDIQTCYGSTIDIFPQVFGPIYNMYEDAAGTTLIQANAQAFRVGPILNDTTFYVQTTNEAGCVSANLVPINVNLKEELFFAEVDSVINACLGDDVTVNITNPVAGVTYNWYTAMSGGTNVFTGTSYTFNLGTDTDLYIDAVAVSGGCDSSAFRKHVDINAVPEPTLTPGDIFLLVCPGDSVLAYATSSAGGVVWYDALTGGNELFRGSPYKIYDNGGVIKVYAEATNDRCPAATRQEFIIQSTSDMLVQLSDLSTSVCFGDDVTITAPTVANVTFSFWDAPFAGNQIGTGSSITILGLVADTTFFVQIDQANCTNAVNNRTAVNLTVTVPPTFAVVTNKLYGCLDDTVSFLIDNPNAAFTYNWYDDQGALKFTGTTFDVKITADTLTYYAEAAEGQCKNPNLIEVNAYRAEDQVNPTVNGGNPTLICKGDGVSITATSNIPGGTFRWYTDSVGGTLVSTGENFQQVGPINNDVSYWVQVTYQNICGDGLSDRIEAFVDVRDVLAAPIVSCGNSGTDFVTFKWTNVPNTTAYVVNVDNGPDVVLPGTQLSYVVNGTNPGQTVTIKVRRKGTLACEESNITSFTCTSKNCTFENAGDAPTFTPSLGQICDGESFQFKITPSDKPTGNYTVTFTNVNSGQTEIFQNGDNFNITKNTINARSYTDPNLDPNEVYTYNLKFKMDNELGCNVEVERNLELRVNFTPVVKFIAIANIPSVVGQFINSFTFNNLTSGTYIQEYNFGDGTSLTDTLQANGTQEPVLHKYSEEGIYNVVLTVTTVDGCSATGTLEKPITVSTVPEIFIPNTFSPNGDGNNDNFRVFGENIKLNSLKVYNQYGNEVYRGAELVAGWNGRFEGENQPSGVYAYTAVIEDFLGNIHNREGTVTLIRK